MAECPGRAFPDGKCELEWPHKGKHVLYFPSGAAFEFTDESQLALADEWGTGGT